jgi:EAL domain-containing protein (putative c-di-GMP-specific phosphodiesterase class I)
MKKLIINNLIIFFLALLLIAATAYIYIADYSRREQDSHSRIINKKLYSAAEYAQSAINDGVEEAKDFDYDNFPQTIFDKYYAAAYLEKDGTSIKIKTAEGENEYPLKEGGYNRIARNGYSFIFSDKVFDGLEQDSALLAFVSESEEGYSILLSDALIAFNQNFIFDFDNIMIISADGIIMADYGRSLTRQTLYGHSFAEKLLSTASGNLHASYLGENKFIAYSQMEGASYKIAAFLPSADFDAAVAENVGKLVVFIGALAGLAAACCAISVLVYIKHYNTLLFLKARNPLFMAKVDKQGYIVRANHYYKENFEYTNIFENVYDTGVSIIEILKRNLPMIVLLKDKSGNDRYIMFFTMNAPGGYRLIGEDATPIMDIYLKNLMELRHNEYLNMYNKKQFEQDYRFAQQELKNNGGLYAVFEIRNINKYRSMFGEDFYNEIRLKTALMFKDSFKEYGNMYYFGNEAFVLLIIGDDKVRKFKDNIKSLMAKFNMPIHIEKSLIKVDCVAGLVDLEYQLIKDNFDYVHSMAEFTLEKAYEIKKHYDIYDKTKEIYFISHAKKRELVKHISENKLLEVYFQPQYSISRRKIVGFEALSRIKGHHKDELTITEFIEIAERTGYMISIGDYVFEKAFEFIKQIEDYDIVVSLNVSPVQLLQTGFVTSFLDKVKRYNIKSGVISLEITETFLMTSFDEMIVKLQILKDNGIKIHLDDFGVAYSSMLYLKKLPINSIKIDKEFVADIINNKYSRVICGKIIDITNELNLDSIAEGVETKEQLQLLKELGCKVIQGFYISGAVPPQEALEMLSKGKIIDV